MMDAEELDLTISASADRIREARFDTVKRGYDPDQVLEYLSRVADRVEILENKVQRLASAVQEAGRERDGALGEQALAGQDLYDIVSRRVAELMRSLDEKVEKLDAEAEAEAERIVVEARAEADRLRLDAESEAGEIRAFAEGTLEDARREAEQALSALTSRREAMLSELRAHRDRLIEAARGLRTTVGEGSVGDQVLILEDGGNGESGDTPSVALPPGPLEPGS